MWRADAWIGASRQAWYGKASCGMERRIKAGKVRHGASGRKLFSGPARRSVVERLRFEKET